MSRLSLTLKANGRNAMVKMDDYGFGDRLMTSGGQMAVFLGRHGTYGDVFTCAIEMPKGAYRRIKYFADGRKFDKNQSVKLNITGVWEEGDEMS